MTQGYIHPGWLRETEEQFQQAVVDAAHALGYRSYHTHDSRRSRAGFPDLILLRDERLVVAELKREGGQATHAQLDWLRAFRAVTRRPEVFLWTPADKADIPVILAAR